GHAGKGQHALDASLGQGAQVAQGHGENSQYRESEAPTTGKPEGLGEKPGESAEGRGLYAGGEKSRDGSGGAVIDVGGPGVEGNKSHLKSKTDHEKGDTQTHQNRGVIPLL